MNDEELEAALQANAKAPTPAPSPDFLRSLEQRLMTLDTSEPGESNVVPFVRRARRISGATLVITLAIAGVAAAATGIVVTHPFADDEPSAPVTVATTDPVVSESSAVETTVAAPVVTDAPTTAPTTSAAPVTSASATTTTEVHTPATIALACHGTGSTVECSWSSLPAGTVKVVMLRGLAPYIGNGRAWGNLDPSLPSWTDDQSPALGSTYSYLIHAYDASGADLGHSNAVIINCC